MIHTSLIGILGVVLLMVGWIGIQRVWHRAFNEYTNDEDALAERNSCGNCGCTTICQRTTNERNA